MPRKSNLSTAAACRPSSTRSRESHLLRVALPLRESSVNQTSILLKSHWAFSLEPKRLASSARSQHPNLVAQLLGQFPRYFGGRALEIFRFLSFLRNVHALDLLQIRPDRLLDISQGNFAQGLVFRLFDADQGGITELVNS